MTKNSHLILLFLLLTALHQTSWGQPFISPRIPSNSASHLRAVGDTVWLGTGKGLGRSTNQGVTWENFRKVPEFDNRGIFAIAVDGNRVWSSIGFEKQMDNNSVQTGAGLTFSTNAGQSWNHVPQPVDSQSDSLIQYGINQLRILPVTVPEQNVTFDIALSQGTTWASSFAGGLRKSTNNGQSWQRILLPPDNRNTISPSDTLNFYFDPRLHLNLRVFSVLAVSDTEIWAGTAGGVNKSTDGGVSWRKFNHQNQIQGILSNWVIRVKEQRLHGKQRIWTTNWLAEGSDERYGVSYTEDGGQTWKNLLHDTKAYDFAFRDSVVYVATDDGVYRTDDDGRSWQRSGAIIDKETRQGFTSTPIFSVAVQRNAVWVAGESGLAKTLDDLAHPFGHTWQVLRTFDEVGNKAFTYAYPNPFSPNFERVRFHYGTQGRTATVTIEVFDFGMNLVRTLLRSATRSGNFEHDEIWDGRDNQGRQVVNGVYFYRVGLDNDSSLWGKVIVLQ
jgi:photosystem II stability/assembly factor-like uncharacterized protein